MSKFRIRIRIETQKNGLKWYKAQECTLSILGFWLNWHNLREGGYRYTRGDTYF